MTVEWIGGMHGVDAAEWDRLAGPLATPFLDWRWLRLLESSGSATPGAGWLPRHLLVRAGGRLVGAAPLYAKSHSEGEFVFDQPWAEVAGKIGVSYYPKLVGMTPFTPAGAYRFLVDPEAGEDLVTEVMVRAIDDFCREQQLSGCAFNYADPSWVARMEPHGYASWVHPAFVWENRGLSSFEDYLSLFAANARKTVRRERRALVEAGVKVRCLEGSEVPAEWFGRMHRLYAEHNERFGPWGCKYLTPKFFESIEESCRDRLLFVAAFLKGSTEPSALALLARKGESLYGRYWGTDVDIPFLHFEVCYYTPMEWAIEQGVARFDPGIGGAHKTRRGFKAVPSYSLHRFLDPNMGLLLKRYIGEINGLELKHMAELNQGLPFKSQP